MSHPRVVNPKTWACREYARQAAWLRSKGVALVTNDYTPTIEENAPQLSAAGREELERASGGELRASGGRNPKFCAPWSSSALVVNVFDYWRGRDLTPLTTALGAPAHTAFTLERKVFTGIPNAYANIDVAFSGATPLTAVEAKFLEPFDETDQGKIKDNLQPVYLEEARTADWRGMENLRLLASRIRSRDMLFRRLDAPQLLKHCLALSRVQTPFELVFLWYQPPAHLAETKQMRDEITVFSEAAGGDNVRFHAITYQELFDNLRRHAADHREYLEYLDRRYFCGERA